MWVIRPIHIHGQKQIVDACPYGAVFWNEELEIPQAWPFDAHLLDSGWGKTKIESCCPTDALKSVKVTDAEMLRMVNEDELNTLELKEGTKPRVYYKNAHVFDKAFIGGTVVTEKNGIDDCVQGATAVAKQNGQEIGRAETDAFGDFKIGQLPKGLGDVTIEIEFEGVTQSRDLQVNESLYIGCISV